MPRPRARGGKRGWSLSQLGDAAGITRGVARAAQSRGFVQPPFEDVDVLVLKVAQMCLLYPDENTALGHLGYRDRLAVHLTRAAYTDPATTIDTVLVLSATKVELTQLVPPYSPRYPFPGFPPEGVWSQRVADRTALVVIPVGAWLASSSTPAPTPLFPARQSIPDDPFGDYSAAVAT